MFDILIKNNPEPIFIYNKENLRFLDVNSAALKLYGYSRDEFLQLDLTDLYSPEDIQNLLETSGEMTKEGTFGSPVRHRRKDGSFIFVMISKTSFSFDEQGAYFIVARDVTENDEAQKKYQIYQAAFDFTDDMVFITDQSGIITLVNDAAVNQLGISKKDFINTTLTSHSDDDDRMNITSSVFQSGSKEKVTLTVKLKTSTGILIDTDLTATPVMDFNNDIEAYTVIAKRHFVQLQEGGEPKEIIKEVIKEVIVEKPVIKEDNAQQINPNFLSGVFHEILTPMNVILGFAQELTESLDSLSPEQKEAVDIINQNRASLLSMMNAIIEFSEFQTKKSELSITEVAIPEIIEPLDKNIKEITGTNDAEFAYGKISSSLKFGTDKEKFESFVNNLVRMVCRFSDQKKIYFSGYPVKDNNFIISVSDKFAQTSESLYNTLKNLFIKRSDPKELGVSKLNFQMLESLLKILGGEFVVFEDENNRQECGFRFSVNLPEGSVIEEPEVTEESEDTINMDEPADNYETIDDAAQQVKEDIEFEETTEHHEVHDEDESNQSFQETENIQQENETDVNISIDSTEEEIFVEEPEQPSSDISMETLSCLYIEDQLDSQILFKVQMKGLKNIQFAASFEEALPILESQQFDFIVMDINLQGEYNGLDALKIIHQTNGFENIPIIAVTAYVLPGDKEKFIASGFNDFISKPIFREKLIESLKKIFAPTA